MNRINYQLRQILFKITYRKKEYVMYIISFYLGLLLPAFCLANIRSVDQVIHFTTFENMDRAVQIDWFSDDFLDMKIEGAKNVSVSGYYEEDFAEWGHQYVPVKGIDECYMYPFPKIKGRMFKNYELKEGKKVCLLNQKYAEKYSYKEGDLVSIHNTDLEIIGFVKDKIYPGILIPYSAMKEVYQSGNGIQFTGMILAGSREDKENIIQKATETILDKDPNAEVIEITDGEELYEMSQATKVKWRALRGAVAVVSILFFLLNEGIVLMEKVKKEQQLFYRSLFWCFLYDSVGLYTEQLTEIVIRLFGKFFCCQKGYCECRAPPSFLEEKQFSECVLFDDFLINGQKSYCLRPKSLFKNWIML